jgi:hypothetical protein
MHVSPSSAERSDAEWDRIAQDWEAYRSLWEQLGPGQEANETAVREKLMVPLLRALGWGTTEVHPEVRFHIRAGTNPHPVKADYVLAPQAWLTTAVESSDWSTGGPWAVIEMKRRGTTPAQAMLQARSYADYLRAPLYAVVDGDSIRIWHRRLVHADVPQPVIGLTHSRALGQKRLLIEAGLSAENVRAIRSTLDARPGTAAGDRDVSVAATSGPDPAHKSYRDYYLRADSIRAVAAMSHSFAEFARADIWWGASDTRTRAPANRMLVRGNFSGDPYGHSPALATVICRLLLHNGLQNLYVDDPDAWRRTVERFPALSGDSAGLARAKSKITLAEGQIREPVRFQEFPLGDLSNALSTVLDDWSQEAVQFCIDELMAGRRVEGSTLWGHETVIDALRPLWEPVSRDRRVTQVLLRSALQTRGEVLAREEARVRLGPVNIVNLAHGVLWCLAIAHRVSGLSLQPDGNFGANLRVGEPGAAGFLYTLPRLHETEDVVERIATFAGGVRILLLSSVDRSAPMLAQAHPIGRSPAGLPVVGSALEPMLFCMGTDAKTAITQGWPAFQRHLSDELQSLWSPSRAGLGKSS